MKDDSISRQAATTIPVMPKEHRHYQTYNLDDAYEQGWNDLQECIEALPPVSCENNTEITGYSQDSISRQAAVNALTTYIYNVCKGMNKQMSIDRCEVAAKSVIGELPPVQLETPNNQTHLCAGCNYVYPECPASEADVVFGNGKGGDNICMCACFKPKEPKREKWVKISPANIYECSKCGKHVMTNDISAYDFCHGCGADMRGNEHGTD